MKNAIKCALACPAKLEKLMDVSSLDELPNTTMAPPGATLLIAPARDDPPADSKIRWNSPCASRMLVTTAVAPRSVKPTARSGRLTTPVTSAPARKENACTSNKLSSGAGSGSATSRNVTGVGADGVFTSASMLSPSQSFVGYCTYYILESAFLTRSQRKFFSMGTSLYLRPC